MDMKQTQIHQSDIEQFLHDVRAHFRASLETSEYENTSNLFHVTAADETERLLERCELLLRQCTATQPIQLNATDSRVNGPSSLIEVRRQEETFAYMEMTTEQKKKSSSPSVADSSDLRCSATSDKTFRSSTPVSKTHEHVTEADTLQDAFNSVDEPQIYDICQVSTPAVDINISQNNNNNNNCSSNNNASGSITVDGVDAVDETQRAITPDLELAHAIDCPYMDLPAGHLAIQRSTKYGQLQRIEKRLFFDQSKKCYCGVLNDWLLCYADGPTSSQPTITLHLKSPGIEIEHFGEGKRREICFQITTADPGKKFVFQANNEVDAKEWIHAIETAIRTSTSIMKLTRKLPTPPTVKKVTFHSGPVNEHQQQHNNTQNERIYEEPSPIYNCFIEPTDTLINNSPKNGTFSSDTSNAIAKQYEYDVPKCPPQPLELATTESETVELLNTTFEPKMSPSTTTITNESNKVDFQTKVKDLHSKLSSQLSAGPNPERLKKAIKKTYSCSSSDAEAILLTNNSPACTTKDQKKQKKSNTPNSSPQKPQSKDSEKSAKNWFLNRLNKTNSSNSGTACNNNSSGSGSGGVNSVCNTLKTKCKQSEKENLLNSLDACDSFDGNGELLLFNQTNQSSNPTSPCLKSGESKSKVNMIINQFENSGHLAAMFSVEALAANALASLTSLCDSDCNNYEPIMTVSTPPNNFMKKV